MINIKYSPPYLYNMSGRKRPSINVKWSLIILLSRATFNPRGWELTGMGRGLRLLLHSNHGDKQILLKKDDPHYERNSAPC